MEEYFTVTGCYGSNKIYAYKLRRIFSRIMPQEDIKRRGGDEDRRLWRKRGGEMKRRGGEE